MLSSSGEERAQLLDDQEPQGLRAEAVGREGAARDSPRAGFDGFCVSTGLCVCDPHFEETDNINSDAMHPIPLQLASYHNHYHLLIVHS